MGEKGVPWIAPGRVANRVVLSCAHFLPHRSGSGQLEPPKSSPFRCNSRQGCFPITAESFVRRVGSPDRASGRSNPGCPSFRRLPLPDCRIPPPLEAEESLPHLSVMTRRRRVIKTKSRNLTGDTRFLIPLRREARRKGPTRCFAVKVSSLENPLPVARSLSRPAPGRGEEKEAEAGDQEGAKGHGG